MTPFTFTDASGLTIGFNEGIISTTGPVTLTETAASNLASKLLQFNSANRVDVLPAEYVKASEYRGLHG